MLDLSNTHPAYRLGRLFAVLEKIQEENQEKRRQAGERAETLIQQGVEEFSDWLNLVPLFPVIKQIESYHENLLSKEMPKLIDRLKQAEDEGKIAVLLKSFVKKIYSPPLVRLKQFAGPENSKVLTEVLEAMYKEDEN